MQSICKKRGVFGEGSWIVGEWFGMIVWWKVIHIRKQFFFGAKYLQKEEECLVLKGKVCLEEKLLFGAEYLKGGSV